jgi:DNA-binding NarL/FixJ family response regulator
VPTVPGGSCWSTTTRRSVACCALLEEVGGWQVVGEAESGEAALPLVEELTPDVVLMDCRMPGQGGVAATREIVRRWPEVAVVAHTAHADETYVREMVAAGARRPARSSPTAARCCAPRRWPPPRWWPMRGPRRAAAR